MIPAVVIDLGVAVPLYEQIRSQLARAITSRQLVGGSRLPSVRALAADLGIAVNTVVRAYSELEAAGLVANRRGSDAVVTAIAIGDTPSAVLGAVGRLADTATAAGLDTDHVIDLIRSAMLAVGSTSRHAPQ